MASYDVASNICQALPVLPLPDGLTYITRHVIQRMLNPRLLSQAASNDVASNIYEAPPSGTQVRKRFGSHGVFQGEVVG